MSASASSSAVGTPRTLFGSLGADDRSLVKHFDALEAVKTSTAGVAMVDASIVQEIVQSTIDSVLDNNDILQDMFVTDVYDREKIIAVLFKAAGGDQAKFKSMVLMMCSMAFFGGTDHTKVLARMTPDKKAIVNSVALKLKLTKKTAGVPLATTDLTLGRIASAFPEVMFTLHCKNKGHYDWVMVGVAETVCHPAFRWPGAAALLKGNNEQYPLYIKWSCIFDKKTRKTASGGTPITDEARLRSCTDYAGLVSSNSTVIERDWVSIYDSTS